MLNEIFQMNRVFFFWISKHLFNHPQRLKHTMSGVYHCMMLMASTCLDLSISQVFYFLQGNSKNLELCTTIAEVEYKLRISSRACPHLMAMLALEHVESLLIGVACQGHTEMIAHCGGYSVMPCILCISNTRKEHVYTA